MRPRIDRIYFAYDSDDYTSLSLLREAGMFCRQQGFTRAHHLYCYVLIGYKGDMLEAAETRCREVWDSGFTPFPMPYRDEHGARPALEFRRLARRFGRPAIARQLLSGALEQK